MYVYAYVTLSHLRSKERAVLQILCTTPHNALYVIIMHCGKVHYNYNALHRAI